MTKALIQQRRQFAATLGAAGLLLAAGPLRAQSDNYPNKPIRLVMPNPAGGQADVLARLIAKEMGDILGQQVIVDNKPGAATFIGAEFVAKSAPDGYTLLNTSSTTSAANKSAFKVMPYDPIKDFAHIGRTGIGGLILVVRADSPVSNVRELIAYAKTRKPPVAAAYWSSGSQVALASLMKLTDVDMLAVPYKGSPAAVTDLIGGQIDLTFTDLVTALPQVRAGKLKALGITTPRRSSLAPAVPAVAEFVNGYSVMTWGGIVAPAGTPAPIVNKLFQALNTALARPEMKARIGDLGLEPWPSSSPAEFAQFVESEIEVWRRLQAAAGIQPQ